MISKLHREVSVAVKKLTKTIAQRDETGMGLDVSY